MNPSQNRSDAAGNPDGAELAQMYRNRFDDADRERVGNFWDLMFANFLTPLVGPDMTVLDLGAGNCEFINRVQAARRIAVDLNPDTQASAAPGVEVLLTSSDDLSAIPTGSVDLLFTSNFFEHLRTSDQLLATLQECRRVAGDQARIVVLMPNLRAVGPRYYDYLDHCLPVTDRSLVEALSLTSWKATKVIPRLLPYGVNPAGRVAAADGGRSRSPLANPALHRRLMQAYFHLPMLWRLVGGQMLVIAEAA
jgi:hypothetical protein